MLEHNANSGKKARAVAIIGLMLASTIIVGQGFGTLRAEAALENVIASKTVSQSGTATVDVVEVTAKKLTSRVTGTITVAIVQGSAILAADEFTTSQLKTSYTTVEVSFGAASVTGSFDVVIMYEGSGSVFVTNIAVPGTTTAPTASAAPSVATATTSASAVDNTAPSVAIRQPADDSTVTLTSGNILVTGTASDGGSGMEIVEVRVDGGSYVAATPRATGDWSTWSVTLPITEGDRRLVPRATDNAGNQAWNSIYITVDIQAAPVSTTDNTAPSVAITNPAANSAVTLTSGSIVVTGTASDSGSGVDIVEVRVDGGSYVAATPRAAGDWSSWSLTLPITEGEHRLVPRVTDNADNAAWNSIYVTANIQSSSGSGGGSSSTLDEFGIEKIYQTKSGGNEWYVDMDDPTSDPMFRNLPSMTRQSDGSWQVNGGSRGQVRMEAWSPSNEKWLNVEITGYAKMVGGSNELIQWYSRGGHHTSSNECLGSAVKARLYGDGEARWVKEVTHPAYTSNRGSVQATNEPLEDRWVGFKAVMYNFVDNGRTYVRMESYIDDDVTGANGNLVIDNDWQLASVVEDRGGWSTGSSSFDSSCGRDRDEILTTGGGTATQNIAAWRSDDLTWNWKYLSAREIVPPS